MEVEGGAEGYIDHIADQSRFDGELTKDCTLGDDSPLVNGCFDCYICLDFAKDPVVTLCGHLYCCVCIYKWMKIDRTTPRLCPVCKSSLSQEALVQLHGRDQHTTNKKSNKSYNIPQNAPPVFHSDEQVSTNQPTSLPDYPYPIGGRHLNSSYLSPSWPMETRVFHSTAGGVLEGIALSMLPWLFRRHESIYYSRSHLMMGAYNTRLRRQEMQTERLLNRIWAFLFCCAMIYLILI